MVGYFNSIPHPHVIKGNLSDVVVPESELSCSMVPTSLANPEPDAGSVI
jgi:hypothetical protein